MPTKLKPGSKVVPFGKKGYVAFSPAMVKLASYVADNILRGGFTKEELARIEAGEVDLNETPLVESAVNTRKFVMMARALPGLLDRISGMKSAGQVGAQHWRELEEIPAEMFQLINKVRYTDLSEKPALGLFRESEKEILIDPVLRKLFSQDASNVTRHEFTHAKQFENLIPLKPIRALNSFMTHSGYGRPVSYLDQPIEIHARAVGRSTRPFIEAHDKAEKFIVNRLQHAIDRGMERGRDASAALDIVKTKTIPRIRKELRDFVKSGVLSAGGATAGVQILNNPRKKTD
jgi:hypothetical protein